MGLFDFGPVRFIPGDNRGRYPFCNSLYIQGERRIIIDPSSNEGQLAALRDGPGIDEVWLSHYHEDHFMFLGIFTKEPLAMSAVDAPALESMANFLDYYGITDQGDRAAWKEIINTFFRFQPRRADRLFGGNEIVDLGGVTVEVLRTPGHTAGHLSFFVREPGVLFIGDYDLSPFPYYGDRDSDIDQTIASVRCLRDVPARVWISPHDKGIYRDNLGDLWDRFLTVIQQREDRLLDFLAVPRTMGNIVEARIVYKKAREPKLLYDFGEMCTMNKHLARLIGRGVVTQEGEYYRLTR
ncbi:MAG: MBL fold metallo-hydrolase [Deltaproteobacteria bacterium]|nr:MBL fold metallo-hydrolase [Candidatus Zymogenaceae bacterium]